MTHAESVHTQAIRIAWVYTFFLPCSNIRHPSHPKLPHQSQRHSTFALELNIQHRKPIESVFNNLKKEQSHSSRLVLLDRYDHAIYEDGLDQRQKQTQSLPVSQSTGKPCRQPASSLTHSHSPRDRPKPGPPPPLQTIIKEILFQVSDSQDCEVICSLKIVECMDRDC